MIRNTTLPEEGFVKLEQVLSVIPVSKSTWYRGVQAGLYPKPIKLGERAVGWKVEEIRECVKLLGSVEGESKCLVEANELDFINFRRIS